VHKPGLRIQGLWTIAWAQIRKNLTVFDRRAQIFGAFFTVGGKKLGSCLTWLVHTVTVSGFFSYYKYVYRLQMLYFAQFAFNSLYLLLFIFDKSTKPRTPTVPNHTMIDENVYLDMDLKVIAFRQRVLSYRNPDCTESIEILPRSSSWHQLESIGLL
jgi:hypothetical protein